jgi:hypothetical protein
MIKLTCSCGSTSWVISDEGIYCPDCDDPLPRGYKLIRWASQQTFSVCSANEAIKERYKQDKIDGEF